MFGRMSSSVSLPITAQKLLAFLARSPDQEFYVRELATILELSVGSSHENLKKLLDMGFVLTRVSGKNRYYHVNMENPSVSYYKVFINIQELMPLVGELRKCARMVVLFGSYATGDETHDSDIDLFVITSDIKSARIIISSSDLGRKISPKIYKPHEFIRLKSEDRAFHDEVLKGITLWRNRDE